MAPKPQNERYSVKAAAQASGLTPDTLRAWERRYHAVVPIREDNGRRLYTQDQIARLTLLGRATRMGHAISLVAPLSDDELKNLLASHSSKSPGDSHVDQPRLVDELLSAIVSHDRIEFEKRLSRLAAVLPVEDLVFSLLLPAMRDLGDRWFRGEFSVGQEHLVSAGFRNFIGSLLRFFPVPANAPSITIATLSGERHEFGALLCAVLAASRGIDCNYLGADTPPADIAAIARETGSSVVGISAIYVEDRAAFLNSLGTLAAQILPDIQLWVGGVGARPSSKEIVNLGAVFLDNMRDFQSRIESLTAPATGKS
jgi:DNA-binding transcriptional MerR regulator/methylmalonyl-CoA mutase cobalamin-binding subunit